MLLVEEHAGRELVAHASREAIGAGVHPGMTLAHARALLRPEPLVGRVEAREDATALAALARIVSGRWSPVVSPDPPDGLVCDIAGCEHLFAGEEGLVSSLRKALGTLGFSTRIAVAGTIGAAWGLARYGEDEVVFISTGTERAALETLPIEALRVEPHAAAGLRQVGVERIAHVLALPRSSLHGRYGPQLLLRIDQALGCVAENVERIEEAARYEAAIDLPGGTTHLESLGLAVRSCVTQVCAQLARHEAGLRRLSVHCERIDAETLELVVQLTRPTRDSDHLWRLLRPQVEAMHLGHGVEHIMVLGERVARIAHAQPSLPGTLAPPGRDHPAHAAMLDVLANRLGSQRVLVPRLAESHRPERASQWSSIADAPAARESTTLAPGEPRGPRPSVLYGEPVPITVMALSPDGPVLHLTDASGVSRTASACIGPERVGGEWWRGREGARDYFRVEIEGGTWLWIFRDLSRGSWFVHGQWA